MLSKQGIHMNHKKLRRLIVKRSCRSASEADANALWAPESLVVPNQANERGRWILSPMLH